MTDLLNDFAGLHRLLDFLVMLCLGLFVFRKRPWIVALVIFLNTLPDFIPIPSEDRVRLIGSMQNVHTGSSLEAPLSAVNIHSGDHSGVLLNTIQSGFKFFGHDKHELSLSEIANSLNTLAGKEKDQFTFVCRAGYLIATILIFTKTPVLSVAGLCLFLIPIPYYLQRLFEFLDCFLPLQLERQMWLMGATPTSFFSNITSNPSGQIMLLICATLLSGILVCTVFFTKKESRTFNLWVPDPQKYYAVVANKQSTFQVTHDFIVIRDIKFDLHSAYYDKNEPLKMKFSTGTSIDFVKRPESEQPSSA